MLVIYLLFIACGLNALLLSWVIVACVLGMEGVWAVVSTLGLFCMIWASGAVIGER